MTQEIQFTKPLPKLEWVLVDPRKARELLDSSHFKNRGINAASVAQYAQAMRDGLWRETGEALMVSPQGLINGQHRLLAVIESGTTHRMLLITHATSDVYKVIDTGKRRSAGDLLSQYTSSYQAAAAVVKVVMLLELRAISIKGGGSTRVTGETIEARYLADRGAFDAAVHEGISAAKAIGGSLTAAGVSHFVFREHPWIGQFFASVRSGADLSAGDPALTLRNRVLGEGASAKSQGKRMVIGAQLQLWFMALRARKAGRSIAKLPIGPDFWIPEEPTLRFAATVAP